MIMLSVQMKGKQIDFKSLVSTPSVLYISDIYSGPGKARYSVILTGVKQATYGSPPVILYWEHANELLSDVFPTLILIQFSLYFGSVCGRANYITVLR